VLGMGLLCVEVCPRPTFGHQIRKKTTDECGFTDHDGSPLTRRREGHFIISDYVDKVVNKRFTNFPLDLVQSETHRSASDILPSSGKVN